MNFSFMFVKSLNYLFIMVTYVCYVHKHYMQVKKLEDRSQKKKIMFLHSKNKASRKGYKGEC